MASVTPVLGKSYRILLSNFNTQLLLPTTDFKRRRALDRALLDPFEGALSAYSLWSVLRVKSSSSVLVHPAPDRRFVWFGGFSGLVETGPVEVLVLRAPCDTALVRRAMWAEAVRGERAAISAVSRWVEAVARDLPSDLLECFFPRGLGPCAVAQQFGVSRQTAAKYLRAAL